MTSNVERLYPSEAYVPTDERPAKAMADQLTTVSKQRLFNKMGAVSGADMERIERAIKVQLALI